MLDHILMNLFFYLAAIALLLTGACIWYDAKHEYISNPFKK